MFSFQAATKKEPLTYYDMNLSAQVKYPHKIGMHGRKRVFSFHISRIIKLSSHVKQMLVS